MLGIRKDSLALSLHEQITIEKARTSRGRHRPRCRLFGVLKPCYAEVLVGQGRDVAVVEVRRDFAAAWPPTATMLGRRASIVHSYTLTLRYDLMHLML